MTSERHSGEGGVDATAHRALRALPQGSLWTRQVGVWLAALRYRPERRYMRGGQKPAEAAARG